ncbi:MAG: integrase core domain-containing protein [Candidatus Dormibacteria bacterium]
MSDNAKAYRISNDFRHALSELRIRQLLTPRYHPQLNGNVERFNRPLLEEWAYFRPYISNSSRTRVLPAWVHRYNYHRAHTAVGRLPPVTRGNNLRGRYS